MSPPSTEWENSKAMEAQVVIRPTGQDTTMILCRNRTRTASNQSVHEVHGEMWNTLYARRTPPRCSKTWSEKSIPVDFTVFHHPSVLTEMTIDTCDGLRRWQTSNAQNP